MPLSDAHPVTTQPQDSGTPGDQMALLKSKERFREQAIASKDELERELESLRAEFERLREEHARLEKMPKRPFDLAGHQRHRRNLRELVLRIEQVRGNRRGLV